MADLRCTAQTAEIALVAATAKTVIQLLAPTNQRVKILGWGVFFDGTSVTGEPVQVRFLRQTTSGTMSALTSYKQVGGLSETIQTTATQNASAEPTPGDVLDVAEVHPQSSYEVKYPYGETPVINGGGRLGLECTAPAGVNVRAKIIFEE